MNKSQKSTFRILLFNIGCSIFLLFNLFCCNIQNREIPQNAIIKAKYIVHDEIQSPKLNKCSDENNDFLSANKYDCSFKMDNYEFDIEDKFIYDKDGEFEEFWNYLSEGPVVNTIEELRRDSKYLKLVGAGNMNIKWGRNKESIITENDTLKIEKIFPKYKLIWIEQDTETRKNGRRILIEYLKIHTITSTKIHNLSNIKDACID